jgi:hypothetical protein
MPPNFRNLDILNWDFQESATAYMVHNVCWYPAKMVPQIPGHLILNLSDPGDTIFDPFCGSGTTLIESLRHGRKCFGTDSNPIAVFISQAKCQIVGMKALENSIALIDREFTKACNFIDNPSTSWFLGEMTDLCTGILDEPEKFIPNYDENHLWFHSSVLAKLAVLKTLIWREEFPIHDVLVLAFLSILRDCSSLLPRKPYTYIADNVQPKELISRDVLRIFRQRCSQVMAGRKDYESQCEAMIKERGLTSSDFSNWFSIMKTDARIIPKDIHPSVDCIITSPPYVGVVDTSAAHRLWYLWYDFGSSLIIDRTFEIGPRRKRRNKDLESEYLADLWKSLKATSKILRQGGYFCLIIGEPERAKDRIIESTISAVSKFGLAHCRTYDRGIHNKWFSHPTGGVDREAIIIFQKSEE